MEIPQVTPQFGENEAKALADYIKSGGWGTEHVKTREFEACICKLLKTWDNGLYHGGGIMKKLSN